MGVFGRPIGHMLYQRYEDLLSGKLKPWELPEFEGLERTLSRAGARAKESTGRGLYRMGIRGPAAAMAMEKAGEGAMAPVGQYVRGMYESIPEKARGMQDWWDAWERFRMMQHQERKIAKHGQQSQAFSQSMPCILATACYGPDSPEVDFMRFYRDFIIPKKIIRGYYVFSDVVLPLMKFKAMKRLVKGVIVDSLIGAGLRWVGCKKSGGDALRLPFDLAITTGLLKFWKILGSRGPYRRKNGELY